LFKALLSAHCATVVKTHLIKSEALAHCFYLKMFRLLISWIGSSLFPYLEYLFEVPGVWDFFPCIRAVRKNKGIVTISQAGL